MLKGEEFDLNKAMSNWNYLKAAADDKKQEIKTKFRRKVQVLYFRPKLLGW